MAIVYTAAPRNYAWGPASTRPAKPHNFALDVMRSFLNTHYAQSTSIANFLIAHPNAATNGVLNQLHRRHIISWDLIKSFAAKAALTDSSHQTSLTLEPVVAWFGAKDAYKAAAQMGHGAPRAAAFTSIANAMCWQACNVFVGPSAGNVGVDIDQADDMSDGDRRDLLVGTPWQGAANVHAIMTGFASA